MWSEKEMEEYLLQNLKGSRVKHSFSVRDTAEKLAKQYGADVEKARIAGLIHDCAKYKSSEELIKIMEKEGTVVDEVAQRNPALLHGRVGAILAKNVMQVEDIEILNAMRLHTTGKKDMSLLEKIIYLSDYIEPLRDFPGVETLRKIAYEDLEKALLLAFDKTIEFVISKGELLHLDTISARNDLIIKRNGNCKEERNKKQKK